MKNIRRLVELNEYWILFQTLSSCLYLSIKIEKIAKVSSDTDYEEYFIFKNSSLITNAVFKKTR